MEIFKAADYNEGEYTIYRKLHAGCRTAGGNEKMMDHQLMQKVGIITQKVAMAFFPLKEGERIPTIDELSHRLKASHGTIQAAFQLLKEDRAVELNSRGHLGTFLTYIDRLKLLEIAGFKTMVGVMPLPYSKKYEGLATGIYTTLERHGLHAALAFMRGSNNRLKGLEEKRYDFAVLSQLTAQYYIDRGENIRIVENFGKFTYVGRHVLLLREDDPARESDRFEGYKIGVDSSSVDQKTLTKEFFGEKDVEYIPLVYSQIVPFLRMKKIDAAVWNLDDIDLAANHLAYRALDNRRLNIVDTEAVVVCLSENGFVYQILKTMLDRREVLDCQKGVLSDEIMPKY